MKCPRCGFQDSKVVDSRPTEGTGIRRRRECLQCKSRFTTYETYDLTNNVPLVVIKKDGSLQLFDRNKILTGLLQACYKRPVTNEQLGRIVDEIEAELKNTLKTEFRSTEIGHLVMEKLKELDDVSYVRFASVYREFKDVETFVQELNVLQKEKSDETDLPNES
ncbi:MAG: transcriptional repressor NrdR [Clostridia bacterium]|nr:transcriptional repressor NrdR [Clostridia bacterium]